MDANKKLSHESWTKGGTLITNFKSKNLGIYLKTFEEYEKINPNHELIISAFAYGFNNSILLENYCSLHSLDLSDLSKFWDIYYSLIHI